MEITDKVGVVTGAGSGIGQAVAIELARSKMRALALVDRSEVVEEVADAIREFSNGSVAVETFTGDVVDESFRRAVYDVTCEKHGIPAVCIPAAGITRDALAVKVGRDNGSAEIYPWETFRLVTDVNLLAPIYWGLEMVARIAIDRKERGLKRWHPVEHVQGTVIFIGSVSSQGNKGQLAYAATKAGLEGAAATVMKEAIFHGVRCGVIHPGFTDTPMVRALGEDYISENILPHTQLGRLIRPEEIADAIVFMITNSAVSGQLWADAGWHPMA